MKGWSGPIYFLMKTPKPYSSNAHVFGYFIIIIIIILFCWFLKFLESDNQTWLNNEDLDQALINNASNQGQH